MPIRIGEGPPHCLGAVIGRPRPRCASPAIVPIESTSRCIIRRPAQNGGGSLGRVQNRSTNGLSEGEALYKRRPGGNTSTSKRSSTSWRRGLAAKKAESQPDRPGCRQTAGRDEPPPDRTTRRRPTGPQSVPQLPAHDRPRALTGPRPSAAVKRRSFQGNAIRLTA
jgi:hypothetical protein